MTTDTDIRLRSRLDSNQRDREQMCRAILAVDPHYSNVRPRHPGGGPDGGRDIEATYDASIVAFGAVGFANSANDSSTQKGLIRKKFSADLKSALLAKSDLKTFAFLTNVNFTMSEQEKMKAEARDAGILHCDILDRERLRIELDSPSGFFIRFQFLDIPLSPEEQASFLSKYGDQVQDVVATGFQRVEKTLNRLLFIAESNETLSSIHVIFSLNKSYPAADIGHFRAFVYLTLRAIKHDIFTIWFGSTDKSARFRSDFNHQGVYGTEPGIGSGIAGGQWEQHIRLNDNSSNENSDSSESETEKFIPVGWSDSRGMDPVRDIAANYTHDGGLIRFQPRLQLRDLNECLFIPVMNKSLAEKLHSITIFSNGYKLAEYGLEDFKIDTSTWSNEVPNRFTPEELSDSWVRVRPSHVSSAFRLKFSEVTPRRMYDYKEIQEASFKSED